LICVMGAVLLLVYIATTPVVEAAKKPPGKNPGAGPGVTVVLVAAAGTSATATVSICDNDTCTGSKKEACGHLDTVLIQGSTSEVCGSGNSWKGYEYNITLGTGYSCGTLVAPIGTSVSCSDPNYNFGDNKFATMQAY